MTLEEYFQRIDLNEIERFVSEGQEENLNLEFKTVNHPSYIPKSIEFDKKNFSNLLSGFANSDGGIVIWGIKAKKNEQGLDVASGEEPIKELSKFLNFLNRLEGQTVVPRIIGVIHEKLDKGGDCGFVKTYIPASDAAPHMAIMDGKHYYKRSGDSFYPCEHYDIVDMFSRKRSPELEVITKILSRRIVNQEKHAYEVLVSIRNNGKAIAKYPYLAINCNHQYRNSVFGLDSNSNFGLNRVAGNSNFTYNYSGGVEVVIYPGITLDVDKFVSEISRSEAPHDFKCNYMLAAENMDSKTGEISIDEFRLLNESV